MNAGLTLLFARRLATPVAVVAVGLTAWIGTDARSAWWFSIALIALIATVRAAALPDAWLTGEGDWIGTVPRSRTAVLASAWSGAATGTVLLAGAAAVTLGLKGAWTEPGPNGLLEPAGIGGPMRSLVLMPGEAFEQPLDSDGAFGREVRVRTTATLGAAAPTTHALLQASDSAERVPVARRTWLTAELAPYASSVKVTNVGNGALAILGPLPVEVWTPSNALLGGHLRAWGHASCFLVAVVSLALLLGVILGPGVAALLAGSLWLALWMLVTRQGVDVGSATDWLPGGPPLGRALGALKDGRSPLPAPGASFASAGATLLASWWLGTQLLRSWRDEVRG